MAAPQHQTWMIEDGVPEVLRHDRLGHKMQGIQATYSRVSQPMRDELKRALQHRWERALDERAAMCARSPVPSSTGCLPPADPPRRYHLPNSPIMGETPSP